MKKENSKSRKKEKTKKILMACIYVTLSLVGIAAFLESFEAVIIFFVAFFILLLIYIIYFEPEAMLSKPEFMLSKEEAKLKREEDERRFKSGEMKGAERAAYAKKQLDYAMGAYHRGAITFLDLQLLQRRYTGQSMIDDLGLDVVAAASRKYQVNRAIEKQQKSATGSMIINAAVGEAIAGTAGAVIGAATSAEKSSQEAAALAAEKASAEQALNKAIEDSITRRI